LGFSFSFSFVDQFNGFLNSSRPPLPSQLYCQLISTTTYTALPLTAARNLPVAEPIRRSIATPFGTLHILGPSMILHCIMHFSMFVRALLVLIMPAVVLADSTTASAASQTASSTTATSASSIADAVSQYTYQGCFNETTWLNQTGNARALSGGRVCVVLFHAARGSDFR
jgi:hypothetical protein